MASSSKRKRPMVVSRHGRYRFQTGLITASLLKRGLAMEEAFAISTELRQQLRGREEIGTEELEEMLQALVLEHLGENAFSSMGWNTVEIGTESPLIRGQATLLPFSRGILLRYLVTAGLEPEAAMSLAQEIQRWLRTRGLSEVGQLEVDNEVELLLRTRHSEAHARRFRLTGLIRRAEKPVIILIGGATGTGKSTLATELAFRLGIRLVTSTDMIRETMRTVLSADVVPGLHDHSFRGMIQGGQVLSDPRERVLAGFRQQAAQVAVGIRAVIRRAIRENSSMIVEGTHLRPPFTSFLPASGAARLCGLVLAVPEESRHRDRFPRRAREQAMRDPDDYLDSFQSVRWIHDDLLAGAERAGCVVVGNEDLDSTVTGVVEFLSRSLHFDEANSHPTSVALPKGDEEDEAPRVPTLFLILDGLADEPNPALGQKTPLAAAATPYLCMLAGAGGQGQIRTGHTEGHIPETDEGLLALLGLGQSLPDPKPGRGLLEALGSGIPLPPNAVVFRGNLATVAQDRNLTDRRAGRIRAGMEDLTSELRDVVLSNGLVGHVFPGHEHRVLVMLQGSGLSEAVSDTDPGGDAAIQAILAPRPTDDSPEAARTAEALRELLEFTHERLQQHPLNVDRKAKGLFPANCIITRGAARVGNLPRPVPNSRQTALISACSTALGVARAVGLQPATTPEMTGNLDTNLDAKFEAAAQLLGQRHFVALHIKGTDIAAHDRKPLLKRDFIEKVDEALGRFLTERTDIAEGLRVVVSADHGTSSITGNHLADPVPVLLATWSGPGEEQDFDEESSAHGALGLLAPGDLAEMLWMS